jgi:hypothetical protein
MNHRDSQHEGAIDKVLTGLRAAEAPAGMEARILRSLEAHSLEARALEARASARTESGWRSSLYALIARPTSTAFIAGSMALASLLLMALFVRSNPRHEEKPAGSQPSAAPIASASPAALGAIRHDPLTRSVRVRLADPVRQPEPISDPVSEEDALALSEMLAPSKPAPPLPLTHQEQLLAEVVHHGEPEELDQLKPEVREKQVEISKAEFHAFFEPPSLNQPPVKDNE